VEMQTIEESQIVESAIGRYIYDAFGRRLKKTVTGENGKEDVTYFGWDGDRQVHTEHIKENGERDITHTVYEPDSFTPLLRLSATLQGERKSQRHLLLQAALAPGQQSPAGNALLQTVLTNLPEHVQKDLARSMQQFISGDITPLSRSLMSGMGIDPDQMVQNMRQGMQQAERAQLSPITVHYFLCDHLGAPIALTDREGKIAWAVRRDPWGNIQEEYDPHKLEQNIQLPGQYLDRETGLYYNRYRYYDPTIGAYINQDPIGLAGGTNWYRYPLNPIQGIDPVGLATAIIVGGPVSSNPAGHVALAFSGQGVYSYGTAQPFGSSVTAYLQSQSAYRATTVYILNTTPEQENKMVGYIKNNYSKKGRYSVFSHSCATATNDALDSVGIGSDILMTEGSLAQFPGTSALIGISNATPENIIQIPQGGSIPDIINIFNKK